MHDRPGCYVTVFPRTVYLTFDSDSNGSGQQAARRLSEQLGAAGVITLRVELPDGHDPDSFFVSGGDGHQFSASRKGYPMTFCARQQRGLGNAQSPFRVINDTGREVAWVNRFLDQERVRSVSDATLRSYAHDLLHFVRLVGGSEPDRRGHREGFDRNFVTGLHSLPDQPTAP